MVTSFVRDAIGQSFTKHLASDMIILIQCMSPLVLIYNLEFSVCTCCYSRAVSIIFGIIMCLTEKDILLAVSTWAVLFSAPTVHGNCCSLFAVNSHWAGNACCKSKLPCVTGCSTGPSAYTTNSLCMNQCPTGETLIPHLDN